MIILKNLKKAPKGKYPVGVVVDDTKGGSMTGDLMKDVYANKTWRKRSDSFFAQAIIVTDWFGKISHIWKIYWGFWFHKYYKKITDGDSSAAIYRHPYKQTIQ